MNLGIEMILDYMIIPRRSLLPEISGEIGSRRLFHGSGVI